ncbi:DNA-binding protein [Arcobacter sp. CECT 8986]|uniref:DNA-binding protein n=1 Tax=unclassified Arcobacter TaxID=2593671 RepID=UPI0010098ECE|nr:MULTISPECIES: DNA-binding protein [unclassified Arcobacter]RXJ86154.1 DNA-binding protein [Arcobacter sp. CECT 8985]RXJ97968.1 DNA-binding protein [Arcobacter sp. CECT 8986]
MKKDLTSSTTNRQNILNNGYAIEKIEENLNLGGLYWKNEAIFSKVKVAEILDVNVRTIERYLENHNEELTKNGYKVLKGLELKSFKNYLSDIGVGDISQSPSLGLFTFRTVLNLAMLVTESKRAKEIRNKILDIVLDVMAEKSGGHTKFINQRDESYLPSAYKEFSYRKEFTDALDLYLDSNSKWKYATYTNKIYQIIFLENAKEYKKILSLKDKDSVRDTMYAEVLNAIASFEHGIATEMKEKFEDLGRKLSTDELNHLFDKAAKNPYLTPHINDARAKMASRDLCFRDALHEKLENYVESVPKVDFDKFLGEKSKTLEERLSDPETLAILKRLKDR